MQACSTKILKFTHYEAKKKNFKGFDQQSYENIITFNKKIYISIDEPEANCKNRNSRAKATLINFLHIVKQDAQRLYKVFTELQELWKLRL